MHTTRVPRCTASWGTILVRQEDECPRHYECAGWCPFIPWRARPQRGGNTNIIGSGFNLHVGLGHCCVFLGQRGRGRDAVVSGVVCLTQAEQHTRGFPADRQRVPDCPHGDQHCCSAASQHAGMCVAMQPGTLHACCTSIAEGRNHLVIRLDSLFLVSSKAKHSMQRAQCSCFFAHELYRLLKHSTTCHRGRTKGGSEK